LGLDITVLCTYCSIIQLHFYKYYAALPLFPGPIGIERQYICNELTVVKLKDAEYQYSCHGLIVDKPKDAEYQYSSMV
jgi:hypothetical protein